MGQFEVISKWPKSLYHYVCATNISGLNVMLQFDWLIVWYVWVCDESHIEYLLDRSEFYYQLQEASIVTSPFEV